MTAPLVRPQHQVVPHSSRGGAAQSSNGGGGRRHRRGAGMVVGRNSHSTRIITVFTMVLVLGLALSRHYFVGSPVPHLLVWTVARLNTTTLMDSTMSLSSSSSSPTNTTMQDDFDSFFFIHQPKTGSSLLTLLRNRLSACHYKDFTCLGQLGGGFPARMSKDGKDHFPFPTDMLQHKHNHNHTTTNTPSSASSSSSFLSWEESQLANHCHGALDNCKKGVLFHCRYATCHDRPNKVTMFREPHKWFQSALQWQWLNFVTEHPNQTLPLPFPSQMMYMTNQTYNVDRAVHIVQHDYVWFGITDYWDTTVCVFHCELGGELRDSEFRNDRNGKDSLLKTPDDVVMTTTTTTTATTTPTPNTLVPNMTDYVAKHYSKDLELYSRLLDIFWERADACGCPTWQDRKT